MADADTIPCPVCHSPVSIAELVEHAALCSERAFAVRRAELTALLDPDVVEVMAPPDRATVPRHDADEIVEGIFLGNSDAARSAAWVAEARVGAIVNCADDVEPVAHDGVFLQRFPLQDTTRADVLPHLDAAADAMRTAVLEGRRALVHCSAGASRSATVLLAYLLRDRGLSLLEAFRLVRARRPIVYPNKGFLRALRAFEERHRGASTLPELALDLHEDRS